MPALKKVNGTASHTGLGSAYVAAWHKAAGDIVFQQAQDAERDNTYFNPSVSQAKSDGLHALGQFIYYDAIVMHGPGDDSDSFGGIRKAAMKKAKTPAQGGNETTYLNAFLDARKVVMKKEEAHSRHQPHRHRAARVPERRQPEPGHAAEVEDVRRQLHDQVTPAA